MSDSVVADSFFIQSNNFVTLLFAVSRMVAAKRACLPGQDSVGDCTYVLCIFIFFVHM
jgi:hypothetical protein